MRPPPPGTGFTLVELLVVLAIMSFGALALSAAAGRGPSRLQRLNAIDAIKQDIHDAREAAAYNGDEAPVSVAVAPPMRFQPATGSAATPLFYADGSSNGGEIFRGPAHILSIDWLTGNVSDR